MMASGSSKKRKIRQDRMMALSAALVFLVILITVIAGSCSASKKKAESQDGTSAEVSSTVRPSSKLEFEIKYVDSRDISRGALVLVNDSHRYTVPEEQLTLSAVDEMQNSYYMIRNVGMKLDTLALKNFNSMMSGFYQYSSKKDIMITEGFVSENHQNILYNQAMDNSKYESPGGCSEHQTGLAVDLGIYPDTSRSYRYVPAGQYSWIKENCTKYGFIQRYSDDKEDQTGIKGHTEHFRYVGVPHAWYMTENNLSLEEYLQMLKKYTYGNRTLSVSCYSKDYEIYYIRARSSTPAGSADIYVPVNCQYTVSGNNTDGFIITVEK